MSYFKGWPIKCHYMSDLNWACETSIKWMSQLFQHKKIENPVIVIDVDDTLVFGDPEQTIGVKEMELGEYNGQTIFVLPPNPPIVKIAQWAYNNKIFVIVLTARPKSSETATITNLKMFNIPYHKLIMNNGNEDPEFKIGMRKAISQKYNIILSVGDQPCDVLLPGRSGILKLPSLEHKNSYFLPGIF